jgi:hypothetical protein
VERKRHLGNDICIVLFKEGSTPFNPMVVKSQFNHVFIVVSPVVSNDKTLYRVEVCSKREVAPFGPYLPTPPLITRTELREFIITKCECEEMIDELSTTRRMHAHNHHIISSISTQRRALIDELSGIRFENDAHSQDAAR